MRHSQPHRLTRSRLAARGFTLVELMIAMTLVGGLVAMIYGMFARTSDALIDVDAMAGATDEARFALEMVRNELQSAGSQASPNAAVDPWVRPKDNPMFGLIPYEGWQNSREVYQGNATLQAIGARNPRSAFSGVVMVGAYDFPQSFLISEVSPNGARVENVERGMGRLTRIDPFDISADSAVIADDTDPRAVALTEQAAARGLRISDRQGYMQFVPVRQASIAAGALELTTAAIAFRGEGRMSGLESIDGQDNDYDAAFLDAFWFRVRVDPYDPTNLQLVRHRLDFETLMALNSPTLNQLEGAIVGVDAEAKEANTLVIANHVVDFRVWFDCADTFGAMQPSPLATQWEPATGACLTPPASASEPHLARVAHLRLSMRSENERTNRPHFEVSGDADWLGFQGVEGTMQTYDVDPRNPGAASVVTVQSSVDLANFRMRGL
ncbi:PilW family protein [Lujinxingia sediminis]|nr:prepilin-type N-terminal cleavage/methylation domain-containing protein [Lujinxingia sediminis]